MSRGKKQVQVKVKNGDIARAIKKFKRKVRDSEHLLELKKRTHYLKPSVKKRLLRNEAIRMNKFAVLKEKEERGHS
jgi:small subunit ribosomal protein S21